MGVYTSTVWVTGDVITATKANNWEIQFNEAVEEGLIVEAALAVAGSEALQVYTTMGPAIEFADAATKSIIFCRYWTWDLFGGQMEIRYAANVANAGAFRVQVGWAVNGGATTNVAVTITPGNDALLHTANLGTIFTAADVAAGDLLTITISRLGADAADTHTGKLRLYQTRFKKV